MSLRKIIEAPTQHHGPSSSSAGLIYLVGHSAKFVPGDRGSLMLRSWRLRLYQFEEEVSISGWNLSLWRRFRLPPGILPRYLL